MDSRVTTGFSKPYVADYSYDQETKKVTYSNPEILARGVEVSISPDTNDDNTFYADNGIAETEPGTLTGGTLSLTVDGLTAEGDKKIYGTPSADEDGWTDYGDSTKAPDVAVGYIARTQFKGEVSYVPTVIARCVFKLNDTSASTGEESVSWQTQSLEAKIKRSEGNNHNWKHIGKEYATEEAAEDALVAFLSSTR